VPSFHLLLLPLALAGEPSAAQDTATYATPALQALIAEAVDLNRRVPDALGGYRARLESEISIGNRRAEGMEMAVSLEQVASTLRWDRRGEYQQVVTGYRSQSIGSSFASLGFFRSGWAIPTLYGNRLTLLFGRDTTSARRRSQRRGREPAYAVHPLAADREQYYRYAGGDTVILMRVGEREIPIVRVRVSLKPNVPAKSVVFLGEVDLDARRRHIVRLRGYFATVGERPRPSDILRQAGLQGIAFVEAENAEIEGQFWLPSRQRFEAHATSNSVGEGRAIFRVLTRFIDRELLPAPPDVVVGSEADTLAIRPFRLTILAPDTMSAYRDWVANIGSMTSAVSAEDFNDVSPDRWSPTGAPRFSVETERLGDLVKVDRIQGLYTGAGGVLRLRDAVPGLTLRAATGWAWNEATARGRLVAEYRRGPSKWSLRAQRSLDLTNDFRNPFDSGSTLGAMFGADDYDYLDRRSIALQWWRLFGDRERTQLRFESGLVDERDVEVNLRRSPLGVGEDFRENRPVTPGRYVRSVVTFDHRPDVSLEFLRPGFGARAYYERGDGDLDYQRAEIRVTARTNRGPFSIGARLDAGITNPGAPPQQFFELGKNQNLPGYDYKEFAGDQAVVVRAMALYGLPFLGAPMRLTDRFWLPPIAPALALSVQSGWTRASTVESLTTVTALGSVPTGHPRASVSLTVRILGGSVGLGIAHALDHPARARYLVEFGMRP
jgi:hypothetical protein